MRQYLDLLKNVRENGNYRPDRTGTGTFSIFGAQMRFDLTKGFPLMTTKKIHLKSVIHELLWFIKGDTNITYLHKHGVTIWDEWADENGDLGPVYGAQWRKYGKGLSRVKMDNRLGFEVTREITPIDQLSNVIKTIINDPESRRMIVCSWNPIDIPKMALPPCHCLFQFYVAQGELSCQLYQRSADIFLGVPFNIASYSLLTHMIAQQCGLKAKEFIWTGGDVHLYANHIVQAEEQLKREPRKLPKLVIKREPESIFKYEFDDFEFVGYDPYPAIKAPIAV